MSPLASFSVSAQHPAPSPVKGRRVSQGVHVRCCARSAARQSGIPKESCIQMKRSIALVLTLASGFALSAAAQTAPAAAAAPTGPAGPVKVAVIAFQAAVGQTNEFQRDFADLQKK